MSTPKRSTNPLCKLGKFYIEKNMEVDDYELSCYIDVSIDKVRKHKANVLKKIEQERKEAERLEVEARPTDALNAVSVTAHDLMKRNERYGVSIMTPEASQIGDSMRKGALSDKLQKNVTSVRTKR